LVGFTGADFTESWD
jgi:carbonic anhydrase